MHIQVLSDLHLEIERQGYGPGHEFYHYDIPVRAEQLALLGDIGWTMDDRFFEWLKTQLKQFKVVYFVSGNHGWCLLSRSSGSGRLIE
jgi:UDP-2,3-diacylglucosamine pyrophosphatase LpxH